ncbi:MAG: excalibur calcium-binding domain-containing protein [Acidobacteria bacterium]|nr:excalibur calcium-binding domain-containing protein [Acidobacteriota bacterium]
MRDTEIHRRDGSPPCTAYSRTPIRYVGPGDGLDREHIVALAEAWDSRPPGFGASELRAVAEDHANLTLADTATNRSKSARDAAEWRPRHNGAWMAHRIVEVKRRYGLSVDPAERDALERLLASGPDRITCDDATAQATAPPGRAATAGHPPVQQYRNCTMLRRAGWYRGVRRDGGGYHNGWYDAERRTYALNTGRDRDGDGHACE